MADFFVGIATAAAELFDAARSLIEPGSKAEPWLVWRLLSDLRLWSTLIGAVVGGAISYRTAFKILGRTQKEARQQRLDDRRIVQQGLARSLIVKVLRIHTHIHNMHGHIETQLEQAQARGHSLEEPWQFVSPIVNLPNAVNFTPEELSLLLELGNERLMNMVPILDEVHNGLITVFSQYFNLRRSLTSQMIPRSVEGTQVSGVMDEAEELRLQPLMIELRTIISGMQSQANKDREIADFVVRELPLLFQEKLNLNHRVTPVAPTSEEPVDTA